MTGFTTPVVPLLFFSTFVYVTVPPGLTVVTDGV
jgi:hypothetical protein